jgi:ribosomal protein S18 acetylase RimI-like enzyme
VTHVRAATADDLTAIASMYAALHREEWAATGGRPPGAAAQVVEPEWLGEVQAAHDDASTSLFVAEADGAAVGTIRVELAERPYFRIAEIRRLYVAPEWRRHGVASRLMRVAEDAARTGGAAQVRLTVLVGNAGASALYRALGYGEFAIRYAKPIDS